jgi:glycosyltransferase involved in cell wall biosynthesis
MKKCMLYIPKKHPCAMIAIPHGEGFGLPIFEAAYSGLPVISVGWSGQCDFLYDRQIPPQPHFYEVGFDIRPVSPAAALGRCNS